MHFMGQEIINSYRFGKKSECLHIHYTKHHVNDPEIELQMAYIPSSPRANLTDKFCRLG